MLIRYTPMIAMLKAIGTPGTTLLSFMAQYGSPSFKSYLSRIASFTCLDAATAFCIYSDEQVEAHGIVDRVQN